MITFNKCWISHKMEAIFHLINLSDLLIIFSFSRRWLILKKTRYNEILWDLERMCKHGERGYHPKLFDWTPIQFHVQVFYSSILGLVFYSFPYTLWIPQRLISSSTRYGFHTAFLPFPTLCGFHATLLLCTLDIEAVFAFRTVADPGNRKTHLCIFPCLIMLVQIIIIIILNVIILMTCVSGTRDATYQNCL